MIKQPDSEGMVYRRNGQRGNLPNTLDGFGAVYVWSRGGYYVTYALWSSDNKLHGPFGKLFKRRSAACRYLNKQIRRKLP